MNLPLQSIGRASLGILIAFASPAAATLSPSIMIVAFWEICELAGLISVPFISAIFSACADKDAINKTIAARNLVFLFTVSSRLLYAFHLNSKLKTEARSTRQAT